MSLQLGYSENPRDLNRKGIWKMADEKPPIVTWTPRAPDMDESLMDWLQRELSEALRVAIVEDGVMWIEFDEDEPYLQFHTDIDPDAEFICKEPMAGAVDELISLWGSDIDDENRGPDLRRKLQRLQQVLLDAASTIEARLLKYR